MRRWMLGAALLGALSLVAPAALADNSALLATAPAEQVGMSKQKLDRITTVFKQEIDQGKLPGVVVMVTRKGKLVYSNAIGFQDTGSGTPMKSDSLFRIYSMTKPFVAAGAMMLVEEGKIQLTDPVSKFLPAFKGQQVSVARPDGEFAKITYTAVPADRENTIQDLFRHTAGRGCPGGC
jgi:CubicO group peptidase (beta-lactamase class C family)